jgi:hypothetical protein
VLFPANSLVFSTKKALFQIQHVDHFLPKVAMEIEVKIPEAFISAQSSG